MQWGSGSPAFQPKANWSKPPPSSVKAVAFRFCPTSRNLPSDLSPISSWSWLLKSADWKYEKEWRYIHFEATPGKHQLSGPVIREIVLGARISVVDESRIMGWIEQLEHKPQLLRASISPNFFTVDLIPVQT